MSFSKEFLFGASTASYQIEGAWNTDGKGENIWDRLVHTKPEAISNKDNGDIACNSYNLYKEDVHLLKEIGFDVYRFSISWSRILPDGDITKINYAGVEFYRNLIDELLEKGIQPMVTMYHWDLPQRLQDFGGWMNPMISDYMEDFADLLFRLYGSKVKLWITINEPLEIVLGYSGTSYAPLFNLDSPANYIVAHNILRAHGQIYKLYDCKYREEQKGKISITINTTFYKEKTDSEADIEARDRAWAFLFQWFANPVHSAEGDYPEIMKTIVDSNSKQEGRKRSRLPKFTKEEVQAIKGSADFFALNHYTTRLCSPENKDFISTLWRKDIGVKLEVDPSWPASQASWLKVVPWGLRELLCYIKNHYNNPPIYITENGYCSGNELNDTARIDYYREYLLEVVKARDNFGCNIIGYTAWSILDNFEWLNGYSYRFGMVYIDFEDPDRKRTLKKSADFWKQLLSTRIIPIPKMLN